MIDETHHNTQPLDPETQKDLVRRWQDDDDEEALQRLIQTNLRFVIQEADKFSSSNDQLPDLIQAGALGLAKAADRFDPDREGVRFLTYAQFWIKNRFHEFEKTQEHIVRLSTRNARRAYGKVRSAERELYQQGESPSAQKLADYLDVEDTDIARLRSSRSPVRLSKVPGDEQGNDRQTRQDLMASSTPDPESVADTHDRALKIQDAVKTFGEQLESDRKRAIWFERMTADDDKTLAELGEDWGISKERIRQVEGQIRDAFRCFLEEHYDLNPPGSNHGNRTSYSPQDGLITTSAPWSM